MLSAFEVVFMSKRDTHAFNTMEGISQKFINLNKNTNRL